MHLQKRIALIYKTCALLDEPSLSDCIIVCIIEGEHYTDDFHKNCAVFLLKCFPNKSLSSVSIINPISINQQQRRIDSH